MDEKRTINNYRELSINLTMCNLLLKEIKRDLARIKFPCNHRNILLHEKLEVEKMKNSIKYSIRKMADDLSNTVIEMVLY